MIYVYAILDAPAADLTTLRGMVGRPLEVCASGSIAAAFSHHDGPPIAATAEAVVRHEEVVERLMNTHPLLPARFNTTFGDVAALSRALETNRDALAAGLGRVRGCVELGVRVLCKPPPAEPAPAAAPEPEPVAAAAAPGGVASGRAYMLARLAAERGRESAERRAQQLASALHDPLAALARENTRRVLVRPEILLTGAYLVARSGVDGFRRCVSELAARHVELRLLCTGPWPPYHFAPAIRPAGSGGDHA